MKYKLKEIRPRVFHVSCDNQYDLAMLFVRYQEYYESPNPKFRGKEFTLIDYMEWYSKTQSSQKSFTYTSDWYGFNFNRTVLDDFFYASNANHIKDFNKYDSTMAQIYFTIVSKSEPKFNLNDKFYLIGANNIQTIKHELSHAYFYLNEDYKKESTELIDIHLTEKFIKKFEKQLKKIGYTKEVFMDEIVAYMSTGVPDYFNLNIEKEDTKPFIKLFKKYDKI